MALRSAATTRTASARQRTVRVQAAAWQKVSTQSAVKAAGRLVVEVPSAGRILLAEWEGQIYAVSNKCSHLGLPLVGKTAVLQGKVVDKCIVCPAHNTAFDLETGAVKGEWCPGFPSLPLVGKMGDKKPLPTFQSRVTESGDVEVLA